MAKVTGIGGVFLKCEDPKKMNEWYKNTLGMTPNDYGVAFEFIKPNNEKGFLQLGTFAKDSDYFGKDSQKSMMNLRVDNMEEMITQLKASGVKILGDLQEYEYGKFLHIEDIDGNKIELWEPIDTVFEKDSTPKQEMS